MEKKNNKSEKLITSFIVLAVICIIAFLFWPNSYKSSQSNDIDTSKLQIKVIVKRVNIREEASTTSKDIGDVFLDEVYDVLECITTDEYYWYKIKTNTDIEGYIASDINNEYVKVISGYIDRTPPVLKLEKNKYIFNNGEVNYDDVQCIDEYSECKLNYEKNDSSYVTFIGTDDALNKVTKKAEYFDVYKFDENKYDNTNNFSVNYSLDNKNGYIVIDSIYSLKNDIYKENISDSYSPIIDLYDKDFNIIRDVAVGINKFSRLDSCINDSDMVLKNEYLNGLKKGNQLCIGYSFLKDDRVKYIAFGFVSDNKFDNSGNILASYYSKYLSL